MKLLCRYLLVLNLLVLSLVSIQSSFAATVEDKGGIGAYRLWKNNLALECPEGDKKLWHQDISWEQKHISFVEDLARQIGTKYNNPQSPKNIALARLGLVTKGDDGAYAYHQIVIPCIFVSGLDDTLYSSLPTVREYLRRDALGWEGFQGVIAAIAASTPEMKGLMAIQLGRFFKDSTFETSVQGIRQYDGLLKGMEGVLGSEEAYELEAKKRMQAKAAAAAIAKKAGLSEPKPKDKSTPKGDKGEAVAEGKRGTASGSPSAGKSKDGPSKPKDDKAKPSDTKEKSAGGPLAVAAAPKKEGKEADVDEAKSEEGGASPEVFVRTHFLESRLNLRGIVNQGFERLRDQLRDRVIGYFAGHELSIARERINSFLSLKTTLPILQENVPSIPVPIWADSFKKSGLAELFSTETLDHEAVGKCLEVMTPVARNQLITSLPPEHQAMLRKCYLEGKKWRDFLDAEQAFIASIFFEHQMLKDALKLLAAKVSGAKVYRAVWSVLSLRSTCNFHLDKSPDNEGRMGCTETFAALTASSVFKTKVEGLLTQAGFKLEDFANLMTASALFYDKTKTKELEEIAAQGAETLKPIDLRGPHSKMYHERPKHEKIYHEAYEESLSASNGGKKDGTPVADAAGER